MAQTTRPQLVAPRQIQTLEAVRTMTGGFDIDAFHVMDERDNQLISDEILHGAGSSSFVYQFEVAGKPVTGISVIGARHLAAHYKGLQHRIIASVEKIGPLFTFVAYPGEHPMSVNCSVVAELAEEADFYAAVVEMTDLKTGNRIQTERRESRVEFRRDGSTYERPNYATIAQSKAYRNAVLALIPQDVVIQWREAMLKLKKTETITASVIDQKRSSVLQFAAQKAIALDRQAIAELTLDQITGLGDAAREGRVPAFVQAARALGLEVAGEIAAETAETRTAAPPAAQEGASRAQTPHPAAGQTTAPELASAAPRQDPATPPTPDRPREAISPPNEQNSAPPEGVPQRGRRVNFEA
jgi:hypothetical protein